MKIYFCVSLILLSLNTYAGMGPNPCWDTKTLIVQNVSEQNCVSYVRFLKFHPYFQTVDSLGSCSYVHSNLCSPDDGPIVGPKEINPLITCRDGGSMISIRLAQPIQTAPNPGEVPAAFYNVSALNNFVTTSVDPVNKTRVIQFGTAYCGYQIVTDLLGRSVFRGSVNCEGAGRALNCELE